MFDIIGKRKIFYWISLLTTIPGLLFILLTPFTDAGLQFTIDFTGGTRWEVRFEDETVTPEQVEAVFAAEGLDAAVVTTSSGFMEIKTEPIGLQEAPSESPGPSSSPGASASPSGSPAASASPVASGSAAPSATPAASASVGPSASPAPSASVDPAASPSADPSASPSTPPATGNTELPTDGQLGELVVALESELGPIESQASLTTIGPVVSADLTGQALRLILVGSVAILLWITYRFRDVKFGVTALVALLHDVILVVGVFAILGTFFRVEVDALFVTGMLTVIGFSVHDTIVVFDRVRENKARHVGEPLEEIVNHSILQTFGRSVMTSFTVFITLLALLLFGGAAINNFILILLVGITAGTYSSIFVASPLLVDWHRWEDRRHGRTEVGRSPRPRRATP
jgi:preprotein translocase SecF subunit